MDEMIQKKSGGPPDADDQYGHQADMLANRVRKRFKHLKKRFEKQQIDIFRLYDWDIPEIRAVVDWYDGHLVVGEYSRKQSTPDWLPLMGKAAAAALDVPDDRLHLKIRKAGIKEGKRYERIAHTDLMIPMRERDLQFYINPCDYVDTGLFSDHRDTRVMIRKRVDGKRFLNLYCYTGAFTCYAAAGGAALTVSVDRSETAVQWLADNLDLNRLTDPRHIRIQKDVMDFLASPGNRYRDFDLAVVDPPSYSTTRTRQAHFDILRDHPVLLKGVFSLMKKGGAVFFSTNHQDFELATQALNVTAIREITDQTIPEDYRSKKRRIHRCWEITV